MFLNSFNIPLTSSGGREKRVPGVKWGDKQVKDQVWKMGNKAMQAGDIYIPLVLRAQIIFTDLPSE